MFYIPFQRKDDALVSPINRLIKLVNDVHVDLFNFHTFNGFYNYLYYLLSVLGSNLT